MKKSVVFLVTVLLPVFTAQAIQVVDGYRIVFAGHDYRNIKVLKSIKANSKLVPGAQFLIEKNTEDGAAPYYLWFAVQKSDGSWDTFDISDISKFELIPSANPHYIKFKINVGAEDTAYSIDVSKVLINDTIRMHSD